MFSRLISKLKVIKVKELDNNNQMHSSSMWLLLLSRLDKDLIINTVIKKDINRLTKINIASLCSFNTHVSSTKLD